MTGQKVANSPLGSFVVKDSITALGERVQHVVLADTTGTALSTPGILGVVDTELPAAALLVDGDAIPTAPMVGAVVMAKNTSGTLDIAKLAKAHDLDTGAGVEYGTGVSVRKSASGGSVAMFETALNAGFVNIASSLVPASYDYISLGYTGSNLTTAVFKTGGSGGTTVATLTLAYTGSRLDSVTKT